MEKEDIEFFTVGHFFGKFKGTFCFNVGVLCKDIGNHAVFICFDDSGDYEKKAPEENFDFFPEHDLNNVKISSASECPEDTFKAGTESAVFHKEAVYTDNNGIFYKDSPDDGNCSNNKSDYRKDGSEFGVFVKCIKIFFVFTYKREKG